MFQTFTETADPTKGAERVALLRAKLKEMGLDGFIVPRADEHQGEYVPASAARLAWLTGFTGSAGTAVVLADKAAIFVDGRYTLQVRDQVDTSVFEPQPVMEISVADSLKANVSAGQKIGYDPWLMTRAQVRQIAKGLQAAGAELVPVDENPVDAIWNDRPTPPVEAGVRAAGRIGRQADGREDRRYSQECRRQARRRGGAHRPRVDRLAVQYPRRRSRPHPLPAFVRGSACGGTAGALHRRAKTLQLLARPAGVGRRRARGAGFFGAAGGARQAGTEGPLRSERLGGSGRPHRRGRRRYHRRRRRSDRAAEGQEDGGGAFRLTRRASSRRRRDAALPALHRDERAGYAHRDRRCEEARSAPRRYGRRGRHAARGHILRVDLLHRPERRDQPLSRDRADQPAARGRRALSDRFRRAVSGRHHRHHPHASDRNAAARKAGSLPRPLHARPQGPHSDSDRALSEGHDRRAARHAGAGRAVAGRARFRPWHRPRRRLLPLRSRRAAADRQDRPHAARGGDDHLQRARLLQGRRFRHPHRKSRRGAGRGRRAGRRPADALLRDSVARPDRPAADRSTA